MFYLLVTDMSKNLWGKKKQNQLVGDIMRVQEIIAIKYLLKHFKYGVKLTLTVY